MNCGTCGQKSGQHYCGNCVRKVVEEQRRSVNRQRLETCKFGQELDQILRHEVNRVAKRDLLERLRSNIDGYKKEIQQGKELLKKEREDLRKRQVQVKERRQRFHIAQQRAQKVHRLMLGDNGIAGALLSGLTMQLEDYGERISMERKKLIMQLVDLFPIESASQMEETIGNLKLPSKIEQLRLMNDDARSAAIAIVVRVLIIAASYLGLPLPYKMEFVGPKASIGRWGENEPQTILAGTGLALESGMIMLRRNVEALCFYQGIPSTFVKDWSLLHCLWQLFHSPSLGNSVHQSLQEAASRIGRVPAGQRLRSPTPPSNDNRNAFLLQHPFQQKQQDSRKMTMKKKKKDPTSLSSSTSSISSFESGIISDDGGPGDDDAAWNLIERPQPPKPSKDEDIQHWVSSGAGGM